ncbi:MAG TPA: kinase/pyrophosphorylase [Thiotrichales bacterium]|nr:kinase/pyrophosphorylase [Thiotrichales bacterium]
MANGPSEDSGGREVPPRTVFLVSDSTGITVENVAHSLLAQFGDLRYRQIEFPFVDSAEKLEWVVEQIQAQARRDAAPPVVFSSLIRPELRRRLEELPLLVLDIFDCFLEPLQRELGSAPNHALGRSHGIVSEHAYKGRIEAINFALAADDGLRVRDYRRADLILVGVSRSGKTPVSLFLAMQYGLFVANYPLVDEELEVERLPDSLRPYTPRIHGLTIDPVRLHRIRSERRPDSRYASLEQCRWEVARAETIFRMEKIPVLDTTAMSVEEIAATILQRTGRRRFPAE